MQSKVEARTDFDQVKNDPIKLLAAIKQHALNYQEHRYVPMILLEAITAVIHCKQRENKALQDYVCQFKTA